MNLQSQLEQFLDDNPYDPNTQARRLLNTLAAELEAEDTDLILYVLALGFTTAKHRQRHKERDYIKNIGEAPRKGHITGVGTIRVQPSKRMQNATKQLILDVWHINGNLKLGDADMNDLTVAINREDKSATGHMKNSQFYTVIREPLKKGEIVRQKWRNERAVRKEIEKVYGEFRRGGV